MKRVGNLYSKICDMENLKLAHQNVRKGKGWYQEVKHVKYYYRYMDDIVILGSDKKELHKLLLEIKEYFRKKLKLTVKDNWQVFLTFVRGIDFVGYRTLNH